MQGYLRSDGRKGIRNLAVVCYLVQCAPHVARHTVYPYREQGVHLIGFPGCYRNAYATQMMEKLCTHPNVGAVLLVSLGCEGFDRKGLKDVIAATGRPVHVEVIQNTGGTRKTIDAGSAWVKQALQDIQQVQRVEMKLSDLIVGTICGGSDGTSGLTANPAIGRAFDLLVEAGATTIFEETGELIGCEQFMAERAITPELSQILIESVHKAERYYSVLGQSSFAPGNAEGGLTTQEEKSLGAYSKSGTGPIAGLIRPGEIPPKPGLYLLDVVPDGEVRFGFPNIVDNAEVAELIACGSHVILFSTGRGSVVGSAIAPVVKLCANPDTYNRMSDDMDINAGKILNAEATLNDVGQETFDYTVAVAGGQPTKSEALGHQEFILTYKSFEPSGPACFPLAS